MIAATATKIEDLTMNITEEIHVKAQSDAIDDFRQAAFPLPITSFRASSSPGTLVGAQLTECSFGYPWSTRVIGAQSADMPRFGYG
jgi:hypothetical protein